MSDTEAPQPLDIQEDDKGVTVKVHLQPRAKRDKIVGQHGDALKVAITAAPIEGQANTACIAFFARLLRMPKNKIAIVSGLGSRDKLVRFSGLTRTDLEAVLPQGEA